MLGLDKILQNKIEKTIEIVCPLYRKKLITEAYIVGSVAKGTTRKESDIDIILINPIFLRAADMPPMRIVLPYSSSEEEDKRELVRLNIADTLKNVGVEFKEIRIKEFSLWYQFYKGEMFHLMSAPDAKNIKMEESIEINDGLCGD